jgi:hypothetical protein
MFSSKMGEGVCEVGSIPSYASTLRVDMWLRWVGVASRGGSVSERVSNVNV